MDDFVANFLKAESSGSVPPIYSSLGINQDDPDLSSQWVSPAIKGLNVKVRKGREEFQNMARHPFVYCIIKS